MISDELLRLGRMPTNITDEKILDWDVRMSKVFMLLQIISVRERFEALRTEEHFFAARRFL